MDANNNVLYSRCTTCVSGCGKQCVVDVATSMQAKMCCGPFLVLLLAHSVDSSGSKMEIWRCIGICCFFFSALLESLFKGKNASRLAVLLVWET